MKFSLAVKLNLFISVLVFILLFPLSAYIYNEIKEISENQIKDYLTSIAEAVEGQIFLHSDRLKMRTSDWSSDGFIRQTTEKIIKSNNLTDIESLNNHLLKNKMPIDSMVKLVDVVGTDLRIIASSEPGRVGLVDDDHAGPLKENLLKANFGEVILSGLKQKQEQEYFYPSGLIFHAGAPIKSLETGETIGFLVLYFQSDVLNKILSGKWQIEQGAKTGQEFVAKFKTSEIYLVNENKLIITPSRFVENAILKQKIDTLPVKSCQEKEKEEAKKYENYLGQKVIGASICISKYKLTLIVEVNSDEIFAKINKEKNDFILMATLLWFSGILASALFIHIFLKNIKIIIATAKEIIKGNFSARAKIKSGDESGKLAEAFNKMLDNIESYQEEIRKTYQEVEKANISLEEKVKDRTKELEDAKALVEKANISLEEKVKDRTKELEDAKASLESTVREKTIELQKKLNELEKFKELTVGRELTMIELKKKIEEMEKGRKTQQTS